MMPVCKQRVNEWLEEYNSVCMFCVVGMYRVFAVISADLSCEGSGVIDVQWDSVNGPISYII